MKEFFENIFTSNGFMPHGHCYFWKPGILWTHVVADGLIAAAYFAIPLCLIVIARKRSDVGFRWLLVLFGIFIYSCGTTHIFNIITVWNPVYRLDAIIKAITAIVSVSTAYALIKYTPKALSIPTMQQWEKVNAELKEQIRQLQEKDKSLEASAIALKESEDRYNNLRDIFDSVVIHANLVIEYANPSAATMLGASSAEDLIGRSVLDFVQPERKELIQERIVRLNKGEKIPLIEQKILRLDGAEIDVETISIPFPYEGKMAVQTVIRDITERKHNENSLRESEAKFRSLFESDMIGTMFWSISGKVSDANNALLDMIGYSREDLDNGRIDWVAMTPAAFEELDQKAHQQISTTGVHAPYEKEYIRKDGKHLPILVGGALLKGHTDKGVSYVIDITERKKQEKILRDSEAKFRHLFELDMLGVIFSDYENTITDANDAFLNMIGYTHEDIQNKTLQWTALTPPGYEKEDQKAIQELMNSGTAAPYEKEYIRKDGTRISVLIGAALLSDSQSVVAFILNITEQVNIRRDLKLHATELQQLNAELEENQEILQLSEARFRRMFESDMIGIIFWDTDGNLLEVNNLFLQIVGYTREDWQAGKLNWINLTPPEYATLDQQKLAELETDGVITSYEKEYIRKDGSRIPIILGGALLEGFRNRGVSYIMDITSLKNTQLELQQHALDLARSNEELEQFAYIASHDLQEPLRTMAGFANLLEKKYKHKLDEDAKEFIGFIVDASDRMKKLITNLLEFSRINSKNAPFTPTDFGAVINKVITTSQNRIRENNIIINYGPMPVLPADATQIAQLFGHLLGNAMKFRDERPLEINIKATEQEKDYLFAVADTGIGIDMAYSTRIFQVFQRLHSRDKYEGTGIGLAVCKKIVQRHGGDIWVKSQLGEGSVFYFTIKK